MAAVCCLLFVVFVVCWLFAVVCLLCCIRRVLRVVRCCSLCGVGCAMLVVLVFGVGSCVLLVVCCLKLFVDVCSL